jgi:hypothetical protein
MPDIQRRMLQDGAFTAVLTLAGGVLTWWTTSRWLWIPAFAFLCYAALTVTGPTRSVVPWRTYLVPAVLSPGVLAALYPLTPSGLGAYVLAATVLLIVWSGCGWWFARGSRGSAVDPPPPFPR